VSESFLGRWSRRKQSAPEQVEAEDARLERERIAQEPATPNPPAQVAGAAPDGGPSHEPVDRGAASLNLPSLESLTPQADFTSFMKPEVPAQLKNAALKKLFTDPHFNVMDGLDTYIDDYTKEDPIPPAMLRALMQSRELRLFDYSAEEEAERQARELAAQNVQAQNVEAQNAEAQNAEAQNAEAQNAEAQNAETQNAETQALPATAADQSDPTDRESGAVMAPPEASTSQVSLLVGEPNGAAPRADAAPQ